MTPCRPRAAFATQTKPPLFHVHTPRTHIRHTSPCLRLNRLISEDKHALHPEDTLRRAGDQMRSAHAGMWPVVQDDVVVGMIEGPNPDWCIQRFGHDPDQCPVSSHMSRIIPHCFDDDDCAKTLRYMKAHHLQHVPVTDHAGHFLGIVTLEDLTAALARRNSRKVSN